MTKSDQAGSTRSKHPSLAGDHRPATRQRGNIADPELGHRHGDTNRQADVDNERGHLHVRAENHAGAASGEYRLSEG